MKTNFGTVALLVLGLNSSPAADNAAKIELKDQKDKGSYVIGARMGKYWRPAGLEESDLNIQILLEGFRDALAGKTLLLSEQEDREVAMSFQKSLRERQDAKRKVAGDKNKQEGATFLSQNKNKPGVITLPSGLQYKVLADGKGESPKATDTVSVNYRGTFIDGKEFDKSPTGQPATFQANGVIKGWSEAMQLMKPGSKWQLFIPSELAYAERGYGADIGPHAALVFEVELVSSKPGTVAPAIKPVVNQPITSDIIKVPSAEELKKGAKIEVIKADEVNKAK